MKKYYTITEMAEILGMRAHQLRYIEKTYPQITVTKLRGRRYYTAENIAQVQSITGASLASSNSEIITESPGWVADPPRDDDFSLQAKIDILIAKLLTTKERLELALKGG